MAWRELGTTTDTLASLDASSYEVSPVVCVAQEYCDEDLATIKAASPRTTVVAVDENLGYAAAVNLGVRRAIEAGAEWVLLVNNDATVFPECVGHCLQEARRRPRTAVVGPAVAYRSRPERLWYAGGRLQRELAVVWHSGFRSPRSSPPPSSATDYVPGCCALVSCDAWREVGPLREDFFMYFEDVEWGERARAAGWHVRYLGEVLCEHEVAASSGTGGSRYLSANAAYYLARNPVRFARETRPLALRRSRTFGAVAIWSAYNATRVRPSQWATVGRALLAGVRDGWRGSMGPRPTRAGARSRGEVETGVEAMRTVIAYDCLFPQTAGGAERWYRTLAERLASQGASVTYLTRRQWEGDAPQVDGVAVVEVMGPADLYRADGTRRMLPPLRFGWGVFRWSVRHRRDVDAMHLANFPFFSLLAARAALAGTGVEVFVDWLEIWPLSFWTGYVGPFAGAAGAAIQRLCIALTPHAFVFLDENADRLRRHGYRGDVTVLPGLLPVTHAHPRRSGRAPEPPVAFFVGRHVRDKGVRLLPAVLAEARRSLPQLRLVVAGDGPERPVVEAELRRLGLDEGVRLTGTVDDEELLELMAHASCTVVPSSREGYGLAVVESTSLGTPVVVAANPENLAIGHVVDGVNGYVVAPTTRAIAAGIAKVVEAGDALRSSTLEWYRTTAPSATAVRSAAEVAAVYASRRRRLGGAGGSRG